MGANRRIDLPIPGLFGPIPILPEDSPDLPSLSRVLGKAERSPCEGVDLISVLFDRFALEIPKDRDLPSAPFSYLAEVPNAPCEGYWLHADPVHLRPDRDQLVLFHASDLQLDQGEADALVGLFNGHFAADNLRLEAPVPERWYLKAQQPPRIRTRPLADVVGRGIERSYIRGEDAAQWMRWLNEVQMLFHHSPVNQRRELAGRPTVNAIWPWGGGFLPETMPQSGYGSVFAGDSLATGLAKAARVETHPLPEDPQETLACVRSGPTLVLWDTLWPAVVGSDGATWVREMSRLAPWLDKLIRSLKAGEVDEVTLYPCDGTRLKLTRGALRRFWRRPVKVAACMRRTPMG